MRLNKGVLFVLLGGGLFGFTPIFAKLGFTYGYSVSQITIVQMIISLLFIWLIILIKRPSFKGLHKKNVPQIMMIGCFSGLTSVFYYAALQYLPASLAIILLFQFVWIGIILEWIYSKVKPAPITVLSILLILIGVFFASDILNGNIQGLSIKGILFGILSACTYAGFIFFSGKIAIDVDPLTRTSLIITGATTLILILFLRDIPSVLPLEANLLKAALGVSLFGAVLPPLFFAVGIPLVSGGLANILTSIELPIAILSASLILSEAVTTLQWLGTAIILAAIALNELGSSLFRVRKPLNEYEQK